jgi:ribosomal protein S18 acetylase RimI-like enzyme
MITYRSIEPSDFTALRDFLASQGWGERVKDADRFHAIINGADRTVVALNDGRVIGFARALCDGASNGYISMVAVAAEFRRQGIGRRLIEHLIKDDSGNITWVLRASQESRDFWERLGFAPSEVAMERIRKH